MKSLKNCTLAIANPHNEASCKSLLEYHCRHFDFGDVKHFKDFGDGKESYDRFCAREMVNFIETDFVWIIQLDGYMLYPEMWNKWWLLDDYVGAPWNLGVMRNQYHKFGDRVGNGGFCIRSRKLLEYSADSSLKWIHMPDDVWMASYIREGAIKKGIRYAEPFHAADFSFENFQEDLIVPVKPFGWHGSSFPHLKWQAGWTEPPEKPIFGGLTRQIFLGDKIYQSM